LFGPLTRHRPSIILTNILSAAIFFNGTTADGITAVDVIEVEDVEECGNVHKVAMVNKVSDQSGLETEWEGT
jgi:hypothetical protein